MSGAAGHLARGTPPAPVQWLSRVRRHAVLCAYVNNGRLYRSRRGHWQPHVDADADHRIKDSTVEALKRAGLVIIVHDIQKRRTHLKLTLNGDWYGETLASQAQSWAGLIGAGPIVATVSEEPVHG
jgi:hypothetical protein